MRPRGSASPTVVAICHQPASSFHAAQPCTPHRVPERYARCHPEQTPLYRIGTRHLEIWLAERSLGEHPVAVHIEEELRSYLRCGILSFGSALNRHVHLHVCVTDGFFCSDATGDQEDAGDPSVRFFAARPITPGDLDTLHRPRAKPTHSVVQTRGTARRCGRGRHARMGAQWAFDRCKRLDQSRRSHDNSPIAWAKLLARIAEAFPLECPVCGGDIRLIAFVLLSRRFSTPICPGRFGA